MIDTPRGGLLLSLTQRIRQARGSVVERFLDTEEVGGSIPPAPTMLRPRGRRGFCDANVARCRRCRAAVEPPDTTGPSGETKPADSPIEIYRHSSAHLLAAAVTELFPEAQCGIGPPTDDGFFYDFLVRRPFTPEDLAAIEKKMAHIVKQNRPIEKKLIPKPEALELFARKGQTLKCELIREKAGRAGPVLHDGGVHRLLPGPAPAVDQEIKAFKLKPQPAAVVLEGQGRQPGDAAHLRVRVLHEGRAGRAPPEARRGQAPRPPQAGPRARPLLDRGRDGRGPHPLASRRAASSASRSRTTGATQHLAGRLRPRLQPPHREARPLEDQRAHRVLQGQHVLADRHRGRRVPAEADELPVPHHDLPARSCAAIASCRCATRSWAPSTASSARACCTACMRVRGFTQDDAHLFCRPDQLDDEIVRVLDFVTTILKTFGFERVRHLPLDQARERERAPTSSGRSRRARSRARSRRAASPYKVDPGEGDVLRAEDRHQDQGLARPRLAVLDHPGGLPQPEPLRASSTSARTARRTSR